MQGVYYRDYAREHAQRLGLVGWARNLHDGMTVEVVAEGPRSALMELLTYLRQGPLSAQVADVDVNWEPARSDLDSFRVRW